MRLQGERAGEQGDVWATKIDCSGIAGWLVVEDEAAGRMAVMAFSCLVGGAE